MTARLVLLYKRNKTSSKAEGWSTNDVQRFLSSVADKRSQRSCMVRLQMRFTRRSLSWWLLRGASRHKCRQEKSFKHQRQLVDHLGPKWDNRKDCKCFHQTGSISDKGYRATGRRADSTQPQSWWNLDRGSEAGLWASLTLLTILHMVNNLAVAADCSKEMMQSWFLSFLWKLWWEKWLKQNAEPVVTTN